jgi:NAD(P)-dependent dehydrogenase (short-subunit alcohol dehydrogenase family)
VPQLEGQVAIVTGGAKGIGKAIADRLAADGARIAVADLEGAEEAAAGYADGVGLTVDVATEDGAERMAAEVAERCGRIDILVNNAGAAPGGLLLDLSEDDWQAALQLKFMGYVRCMKAVIPFMLRQGGGRIVNIVGNDGVKPIGVELTPSAANAADLAVTLALAEQYGSQNICINAINPGPVATERWDGLIAGIARVRRISADEAQKRAERSIPLGRICTPEEVANVAVFVASERASFMNGALITLDGGQRKALLD